MKEEGGWKMPLLFSDLHDLHFVVARVYMRSLYELARGAHAYVEGMPDPNLCMPLFKAHCKTWSSYIDQRALVHATSEAIDDAVQSDPEVREEESVQPAQTEDEGETVGPSQDKGDGNNDGKLKATGKGRTNHGKKGRMVCQVKAVEAA
eukprot:329819-Amphidinium_carterae.1